MMMMMIMIVMLMKMMIHCSTLECSTSVTWWRVWVGVGGPWDEEEEGRQRKHNPKVCKLGIWTCFHHTAERVSIVENQLNPADLHLCCRYFCISSCSQNRWLFKDLNPYQNVSVCADIWLVDHCSTDTHFELSECLYIRSTQFQESNCESLWVPLKTKRCFIDYMNSVFDFWLTNPACFNL